MPSSRGSSQPRIEPPSLVSPALQEDSLPAEPLGKPHGVQLATISGLTPNKLHDLENKRFYY